MPDLRLPGFAPGARPPAGRALTGIVEHDQLDDWLPDPVYYDDFRADPGPLTEHVERAWQARVLPLSPATPVTIPRDDPGGFTALALAPDVRLAAHQLIAAMAPTVGRNVERDKIYGFEYHPDGVPLFSGPGDGLREAIDAAATAAVVGDTDLVVADVVGFNRQMRIELLEQALQQRGARPEETEVLRALTAGAGPGLPSIDDAFAFAYNFYLDPVDRALFAQAANVFRYRDEYYLPDRRTERTLAAELKAVGLTARVTAHLQHLFRKADLAERATPERDAVEEIIGPLPGGELVAKYECQAWDDELKHCVTDYYEVAFEDRTPTALPELFALPADQPLDGVRVLPLLRAVHGRRRPGVWLQPPFRAASPEFQAYRRELEGGRGWLLRALRAAIGARADWQITWTAVLLSDLGPLTGGETLALREAARAGGAAAVQARLALARSSTLGAADTWVAPAPADPPYVRRAALLAAGHLARRGAAGPWSAMRAQAGRLDRPLVDRLEAYVRQEGR